MDHNWKQMYDFNLTALQLLQHFPINPCQLIKAGIEEEILIYQKKLKATPDWFHIVKWLNLKLGS